MLPPVIAGPWPMEQWYIHLSNHIYPRTSSTYDIPSLLSRRVFSQAKEQIKEG